jgi:WD40 repeat protein
MHSTLLITGCQDQQCRIWDTRTAREQCVFKEHKGIVLCVKYAADDSFVVSAGSDRRVLMWKHPELTVMRTLVGHTGAVFSVDVVGSLILSGDEKNLFLWNAVDGSTLLNFSAEAMINDRHFWTAVCFFPGGSLVAACASDRSVRLYSTDGSEVLSVRVRAAPTVVSRGVSSVTIGDFYGNNYLMSLF